MWICMDLDNYNFPFKYRDAEVLHNTAFKKLGDDSSYHTFALHDALPMAHLTFVELDKLYASITGEPWGKGAHQRKALLQTIFDLLIQAKPTIGPRPVQVPRNPNIEERALKSQPSLVATVPETIVACPKYERQKLVQRIPLKEIVFAHADDAWAAAGKPKAVNEILALRKVMMDDLETSLGVNRNSASGILGQWQKSLAI